MTAPVDKSESERNAGGSTAPLACSVCQREIPPSAAIWRESSDYVAHFCGLECYDRWRKPTGS